MLSIYEKEVKCTSCECLNGLAVGSSKYEVIEDFLGVSIPWWTKDECEFGSKWSTCVLLSTVGIFLLV